MVVLESNKAFEMMNLVIDIHLFVNISHRVYVRIINFIFLVIDL